MSNSNMVSTSNHPIVEPATPTTSNKQSVITSANSNPNHIQQQQAAIKTQSAKISSQVPINFAELCELSSNDLNFLSEGHDSDDLLASNGHSDSDSDGGCASSTVRDLDNILSKFEADPKILLENPNQLLNCKYSKIITIHIDRPEGNFLSVHSI